MHLDLHVPRFTWPGGPASIGPTLTSLARTAESIGVRTLSVMDHWFQMEAAWPAEEPMLEGYTTLGFVAAKTETLRIRLLVGGVTYRPPGLLAKTITTLDVLSAGRAELGIGAAWYEREHRGLGVPFPPVSERFERLEETLQICLQMWSDNDGAYQGAHYQLAETLCSPPPVSSPRPRILIGGGGNERPCGWSPPMPTHATSSATRRRWPTSSTSCAVTATTWGGTRRRSRSPPYPWSLTMPVRTRCCGRPRSSPPWGSIPSWPDRPSRSPPGGSKRCGVP